MDRRINVSSDGSKLVVSVRLIRNFKREELEDIKKAVEVLMKYDVIASYLVASNTVVFAVRSGG
jgi:hypothetical protein